MCISMYFPLLVNPCYPFALMACEQFMKKATFKDNFNPNGGEGGAVANTGDLTFYVRSIFQK